MIIKGIGHVGVVVENLEEAINFYHGVLGLEVYEEPGEMVTDPEEGYAMGLDDCLHRIATLRATDGTKIELVEFESPKPVKEPETTACLGKHHISFLVDDINAWLEKLKEYDIQPFRAPLSYETDEAEGGIAYWAQMRDPYGVVIEMMQY